MPDEREYLQAVIDSARRQLDSLDAPPAPRAVPVIVVTLNNLALSKKTIKSCFAQDIPVEILAVDNGSTDGTRSWLASKHLTTIMTPEQWSLARCWNVALQALWKAGHKCAVILNNDSMLRSDAIRLLTEHGGDFVTCVSVSSEDQLGTPGDRDIDSLRSAQREHPDHSAFLIRKHVTDVVGWFDEKYFPAYGEDADFHVRCVRRGIRPVCIDIPFVHFGASTLKSAEAGAALQIRRGADANRERFRKTYGCSIGTPEYYRLFEPSESTA